MSLFIVVFFITTGIGTSVADDSEVYTGFSNTPKVLFVLDVSGSMGWSDDGYTGTRIQRMKTALSSLLGSPDIRGVDVGLMSYSGNAIKLLHPVANVVQNQSALQRIVRRLQADGGTPTVSAMYEASLYLRGEQPYQSTSTGKYTSPVSRECESSHIVMLTDGEPTDDTVISSFQQQLFGKQCVIESYASATCGVELATDLATNDQLPLPGVNNITTHSIGFNLNSNWVRRVAAAGGGVYADAASTQDLLDAFTDIIDSVEIASAASAPTISINAFNESRHRDELYYSFFQPYKKPRWDGNVKKYRLHEGQIVDKNNNPVLDADGIVQTTSVSFWSDIADGEKVTDGGMAAKQPAGRRWYTDAGVAPVGGIVTPIPVTDSRDISLNALNAANDAEREQLVNWVRGYDSTNPTEASHFVADSLHNSPLLVTYKARELDDTLEEAIFSANNMGVLHAVRADTGEELWSYSPEELLPNIKTYFNNDNEPHIYGLDGNMVVHSVRKTQSDYDYELDKARLYMTQRRGGRGIFALDITDAMDATKPPLKVMWKISGGIPNTDFRDLGQTWATPQIIPIRVGCPDYCEVKEVLMFGGGYNPIYDDKSLTYPAPIADTGHGNAIYMVDPESGQLLWSAGNGIHHDLELSMQHSVPTTPVPVDTDADGVVDILFVSDLAGSVWRIDLKKEATDRSDLATGGKIADLSVPGQAMRFFNRVDVVISGTTQGTAFFNLVLGSGMRSSPLYDEPIDNRLYVLKDPWVFSAPPKEATNTGSGEALPRYSYIKNSDSTYSPITPGVLWEHGTTAATGSRNYGYFKTFGEKGEKILQPTLTHSGRVFAVSYVPPDQSVQSDSCNYNLGESRLHIHDLADGSNLLPNSFGTYKLVGSGITSIGSIVDTGDGDADFVTGLNSQKLIDLLSPANPNVFRRFVRTGWLERDDQ